jgi:hypothetical protein
MPDFFDEACRRAGYRTQIGHGGRYGPCHLMGFSRGADERLQAAGGCAFARSFVLAWPVIT